MLEALALGLVFSFVIHFARALPWTPSALAKKPLACDACMSGWCCIVTSGILGYLGQLRGNIIVVLAAGGLSMLALALYGYLKGPSALPPLG